MLLQQEAKEIMGNIFLVHWNNHADVFKVSNMEKYIFKRYYSLMCTPDSGHPESGVLS